MGCVTFRGNNQFQFPITDSYQTGPVMAEKHIASKQEKKKESVVVHLQNDMG